eukprot:6173915-Pleurochrysis_carterae.AAC.1
MYCAARWRTPCSGGYGKAATRQCSRPRRAVPFQSRTSHAYAAASGRRAWTLCRASGPGTSPSTTAWRPSRRS